MISAAARSDRSARRNAQAEAGGTTVARTSSMVRSVFAPHSHDAADMVDAALEDSDEGPRALKISVAALGVTVALQLVVVVVSGSVALLADTIHNFADAVPRRSRWASRSGWGAARPRGGTTKASAGPKTSPACSWC